MRKRKKMRPAGTPSNARGADPESLATYVPERSQTSQSACGPRLFVLLALSADAALDCTRPPPRSRPPHKHRDHYVTIGSGTSYWSAISYWSALALALA
jgi:hypothetical protein